VSSRSSLRRFHDDLDAAVAEADALPTTTNHAIRTQLCALSPTAPLAKTFKGAKIDGMADILEALASLGQARSLYDEKYVAAESGVGRNVGSLDG